MNGGPGADDPLLLFASEQDTPSSRPATDAEDDPLAAFLPESALGGEPSPASFTDGRRPWRGWPVRQILEIPAARVWHLGVGAAVCGVGVVALIWVTRTGPPGPDAALQNAAAVARRSAPDRLAGASGSGRSTGVDLPALPSPSVRGGVVPPPLAASVIARVTTHDSPVAESSRADTSRAGSSALLGSAAPAARRRADTAGASTRIAAPVPRGETQVLSDADGVGRPAAAPLQAGPVEAGPLSVGLPVLMSPEMRVSSFPAGVPAAGDADSVRRTLEEYRAAYEDLDVLAAASVWPTVDRRALARAFSTLESQGVTLGECDIRLIAATATARCRGSVRVVRKVGGSDPMTAEQGWLFRMRKSGESWTIDDVTGWRTPPHGSDGDGAFETASEAR